VLLNQADTPELQSAAHGMSRRLLEVYDRVVVTSLREEKIHAVYERIAGIILAAGGASRMKAPKLLLEWRGKAFIHHVARTALEAGLDPVVVVTGAYSAEVEAALQGLPIKIAHNPDWANGQSTSLGKGLGGLPRNCGGAVFLLGDQPQIPPTLINALVGQHSRGLAPVTAPFVDGQRGNPLLWDRDTFESLVQLEGDAGGRQLLARYPIDYIPWVDAAILMDVDTPEDYQRFIDATG
jgi:molybdenum cofactor cytidylyltransferase